MILIDTITDSTASIVCSMKFKYILNQCVDYTVWCSNRDTTQRSTTVCIFYFMVEASLKN